MCGFPADVDCLGYNEISIYVPGAFGARPPSRMGCLSGSDGVSAENHLPSRVLSELRTLEVSRVAEISRVGAGLDREAGSEAGQAPAGTYLPRRSRNMISCETQCPPGDREKNRPPHPRHQKHRGPKEESVGTRGRVWRVCKFQFNFVDILNPRLKTAQPRGSRCGHLCPATYSRPRL